MSRFLISVGATLACVLAALFFLPQFVDWNHYRSVFEDEASRLLGREVRVGGEVNLRLLPTPYIRFDRVRVADNRGGSAEPLLKADEFTIRLAVAPLFRGALEATHVELTRPVLTLVADANGGGNWNSLASSRPRSMFMPRQVTLRDVRILGGAVILKQAAGEELSRFEVRTAELTAADLEGPYKLQAMVKSAGGLREVRLSTAKQEPDGSIRFKGTLRTLDPGPTYTIDGQLAELAGRTRITGDLTASLLLQDSGAAGASGSDRAGARPGEATSRGYEATPLDLKAVLRADTDGVQLSDLALSFDSGGQPQLASGDARFLWRQGQPARLRLESRWFDLDRVAGGGPEHSPVGLVARLAGAIDQLMPNAGLTQAVFSLDQATLGGEIVSGLRLVLDKTADGLKLRELRASLPGGTHLEASGTMSPARSDVSFDGDITLRGASLNRFLGWVGKGRGLPELKHDGSFAMRGSVAAGPDRFAGRGIMLQLAGNALYGEGSWQAQTRRLSLTVEASELDASPLLHGDMRPAALLASLLTRQETGAAKSTGADAAPAQSSVRVRAGRMIVDGITLRDVVADIDVDRDSLRVPLLKFTSEDGLAAELRGTMTGLAGSAPKGSLGGELAATRGASVRRLLEVLGVPEPLLPSPRRAEALAPFRLGTTLAVGARGASTFDLSVDGMLASSRLNARAQFEDPRVAWRQQRLDLVASLENAEISSLLAQLLPDTLAATAEKSVRTPGRATIKAAGTPARGLASLIALDAPGTAGEFRGRWAVDETASVLLDGEIRASAEDLGHAGPLVGFNHRSLNSLPLQVVLGTKLEANRLKLEVTKMAVGPVNVLGQLDVDLSRARPRAEGRLRTAEISLPRLMGMMADRRSDAPDAARAQGDEGKPGPWPEGALDLAAITAVDGKVRFETPELILAPGISATAATVDAEVENGRLGLKLVEARALNGKAAAQLSLEKAPAGVSLKGQAKLTSASLEAAMTGAKPAASGEFEAQLEFSGVGLSPRGLVAALRGKGVIDFGGARLNRMSPAAINSAALAALAAPGENFAPELRRRLEDGLGSGAIPLGPRKVGLEIADGVLRAEPISLETADGRVTGSTTVELETLAFDSEWRIEPKPTPARAGAGKGSLPGVTLVYVGKLAQLTAAQPRLQSEALERELNVRKMERYVEELERLRRQDEERVRQEAERLRNMELERQQRLEDEQQRALRKSAIEPPGRLTPSSGSQPSMPWSYGAGNVGTPQPAAKARPTTTDIMRDLSERSN